MSFGQKWSLKKVSSNSILYLHKIYLRNSVLQQISLEKSTVMLLAKSRCNSWETKSFDIWMKPQACYGKCLLSVHSGLKQAKSRKWYFVSLFSSNSCGKQLEKPNEHLFCIFKLKNGGRKQANGSRDSFRPKAKPRVGMVRGCHLPAWDPHFSTRKYKITWIWSFKVFFGNVNGKKVKQITSFCYPTQAVKKTATVKKTFM